MVAAANVATLTAIPGVLSGYKKQCFSPNEANRALDDDQGVPPQLPGAIAGVREGASFSVRCKTSCERVPSGATSVPRRSTNFATGALAILMVSHCQPTASLLGAFWLVVFIYAAAPPAVAKPASYRQLPVDLATMLRLLQPAVMLLSDQQATHSGLLAYWPEPSSPPFWAFLLHSLSASKTLMLALATFSGRMPFRRHLGLQALALAAAVFGSYGACDKACAAHGRILGLHLDTLLRSFRLMAAPAFATTGLSSTAGELLPLPATPRFQCWLAWCFQALLFGFILPSLLLLWLGKRQQPPPATACPRQAPITPRAFFRGDSARQEEVPARRPRPAGADTRAMPAAPAVLTSASMTNGVVLVLVGLALLWSAVVVAANVAEGLALGGLAE